MSDLDGEAPSPGAQTPVDWDEFKLAVSRLLEHVPCRVCKAVKQWDATIDRNPDVSSGIPFFSISDGQPIGFARSVPVVCQNCGYIELFDPRITVRNFGQGGDG